MSKDTLQKAIQREVRDGAIPIEEVVAGKNVSVLVRDPRLRGRPFIPICATIVGETGRGNVQVYLYAAGTEKRLVPREAIFTRESAWCRGEAIALVCHSRTHCWGIVYNERREYIRIYPLAADQGEDCELTEQQVLTDFLNQPLTFQEVQPGRTFQKELRIVTHRGQLLCVRAEALLHRDWNEQYRGGYVTLSGTTLRKEPLETLATDLCYVSTCLQRKVLSFVLHEAPDAFFIERDFKQVTKQSKSCDYYLIHDDKIYKVRSCWESQLCTYLRGEMPLDELFRYACVVWEKSDG
jgi:hypothetical protein